VPDDDDVLALIPAYNAAGYVGPVVEGAAEHLPVLVIDDGSTDHTLDLARAAGAEAIRQFPNQGKGEALKRGFRSALDRGYRAVMTLDADGQHDPSEIPKFLAAREASGADLIIGARDFSEMPLIRRVANTIGRWSLSRALGRDIPDNQSGYRLASWRLAEAMLRSEESGFEFEVDMLLTCVHRDWRVEWVPIRTIYRREDSHIRPFVHIVRFFRMVVRARRSARLGSGPR
jgi:glycosyltransferase involved in cell wall biosynthesis